MLKNTTVIPIPGLQGVVWVFSGTQYARIKIVPSPSDDELIFSSAPIAENWPFLVKAGFRIIDAVFPASGIQDHVYIFTQYQFARITLTPGKPESSLMTGPAKIAEHWPALYKTGFNTVDTVFPTPGISADGYFFSGDKFIYLTVKSGQKQDTVVSGPANVAKHWSTLDWIWIWAFLIYSVEYKTCEVAHAWRTQNIDMFLVLHLSARFSVYNVIHGWAAIPGERPLYQNSIYLLEMKLFKILKNIYFYKKFK